MKKKIFILLFALLSYCMVFVGCTNFYTEASSNSPVSSTIQTDAVVSEIETNKFPSTTVSFSSDASSTETNSSSVSSDTAKTITSQIKSPKPKPKPVKNICLSDYTPICSYYNLNKTEQDGLSVVASLYKQYKESPDTFNKNKSIPVSFGKSEFYNISSFLCLYYGEPTALGDIFYFYTNTYKDGKETHSLSINPEMIDKLEQRKQECDEKIDAVLSSMKEGSETEKLMQIAEYLKDTITYTLPYRGIYDGLMNGTGVCTSFALSFQTFANRLGIQCDFVIGDENDGTDHAYNRVRLSNGEYRYYDVTFYDGTGDACYLNTKTLPYKDYCYNTYAYRWGVKF